MARQFKKLAHSLYECKYHVVFCPKYRYKILQEEVAKYVMQQIYRLCSQKDGVEVVEGNVQIDHVHLVVSIPPKYAVSRFMGFLKGKLALQLFDRFPQLRKKYWGQHGLPNNDNKASLTPGLMRHPLSVDNIEKGLHNYLEIQPKGVMLQIVAIIFNLNWNR